MTLCRKPRHSASWFDLELDIGELRHAIDRQEHVQLAVSQAQLAVIDVDIADRCLANLPRFEAYSWLSGSREMPCRPGSGADLNGSGSGC